MDENYLVFKSERRGRSVEVQCQNRSVFGERIDAFQLGSLMAGPKQPQHFVSLGQGQNGDRLLGL